VRESRRQKKVAQHRATRTGKKARAKSRKTAIRTARAAAKKPSEDKTGTP